MLRKFATVAGMAIMTCASVSAEASIFTLDFTGVANGAGPATVGGFYNGGTSGDGNSGTNYGVAFTGNALALNSYPGQNEPNPGILAFSPDGSAGLDYAPGFKSSFAFSYAAFAPATITLYDGLGGTGTVLATLSLVSNFEQECGFCQWDSASVTFSGIARSIDFGGSGNNVAFDQLTFDSVEASAVPEPKSWAMLLAGFAAIGFGLRRRAAIATRVRFA